LNKKAALVHLTIFGVLIAIAVFFFAVMDSPIDLEKKGEWHIDFLENNFLEAEKDKLRTEAIAKNVALEAAEETAKYGGFSDKEESSCGLVDGFNLWNLADKWCYPDVQKSVARIAEEKFTKRIPGKSFTEFGINGSRFFAQGKKVSITSDVGEYIYDSSFLVEGVYSFDQYDQLFNNAKKLVENCRNRNDLDSCLEDNILDDWKIIGKDVAKPKIIFIEAKTTSDIHVKFALDFTPTKPLVVEDTIIVSLGNEQYEVSFSLDQNEDSYNLYYTNWDLDSELPVSSSVITSLPKDFSGKYWEKETVIQPSGLDTCPTVKNLVHSYLCERKVTYVVQDPRIDENTLFTVTSMKDNQESEIIEFVTV